MEYSWLRDTLVYRPLRGSHHARPLRSVPTAKREFPRMKRKPGLCPAGSPVSASSLEAREGTSPGSRPRRGAALWPSGQVFAEAELRACCGRAKPGVEVSTLAPGRAAVRPIPQAPPPRASRTYAAFGRGSRPAGTKAAAASADLPSRKLTAALQAAIEAGQPRFARATGKSRTPRVPSLQ